MRVVLGFLLVGILVGKNPNASAQPASGEENLVTAVETVSQNVGPTVVSIHTEKIESYRQSYQVYGGDPMEDELFQKFFEDFFGELPERHLKRSGLGSGVIINKDGFILTNEHVVEGADKITVTLSDGREFKGQLKGTDQRSDLAVIKIDAPDLPFAPLGDSDLLKTGQWVVAIGNPFGFLLSNSEPTGTTGVISALHRTLPRSAARRDSVYTDLIQTDAAINPGNSGGPLVNLKGQVIGINVAIFSTSGGYQGVGFAIPVNAAKRIVEQLIKGEPVAYGWVGISAQEIDERLAEYFHLEKSHGVLIVKALEGAPAQKAGVQDGDILLSLDGQPITNVQLLLQKIGNAAIGKPITLEIIREGKSIKIPVVVLKRPNFDSQGRIIPEEGKPQAQEKPETPKGPIDWRGVRVRDLTPELSSQLAIENIEGIVIVNIDPHSPAAEAGLRRGDILMAINQTPVKSVDDFENIIKQAQGSSLVKTTRGYFVVNSRPESKP